jgi:O-antigen ligase
MTDGYNPARHAVVLPFSDSWLMRAASMALCVGIFVLPLITVRDRLVTFALSDAVLPIVLLGGLTLASARKLSVGSLPWVSFGPFFAWFGWLAFSALSGAQYQIGNLDSYVLKKLLGFVVLGAYVGAGYVVARALTFEQIVRLVLYAAAAGSLVGYIRLYFLPYDIPYAALPYGFRLVGMTHNPNLFGLQQAAAILFSLDAWRRISATSGTSLLARPRGDEWLVAIAMAGLWLSGSRTATIAFIATVVLAMAVRRLDIRELVRVVALSIAVAVVSFAIFSASRAAIEYWAKSSPVLQSFFNAITYAGTSIAATEVQGVDHRAYIHGRAWQLFMEHPWTGIGLGQFYLGFRASADIRAAEIHNSYLWIMTELGLVGATIALCCIAAVVWKSTPWRTGIMAPLALIAFYAVSGLGADVLYQRPLYLFSGILAASLILRGRIARS